MNNRTDWFYEAKFGLFVHWTTHSLPKEGEKKSHADAIKDFQLDPSSWVYFEDIPIEIGEIDFGYRLVAQFFNNGSGEWEKVRASSDYDGISEILLADEPTGALDYKTGKQVLKVLQDMSKERNMTVVMITHNGALANMGQKIIKVRSGHIEDIIIK